MAEDLATLEARLKEAEGALHRLMTGTAELQLHHDDMSMTYQAVNPDRLRAYIGELKVKIVAAGGTVGGFQRKRPLYVVM